MIPEAHITAWAQHTPWPTRDQVEQDLILSRLIIEIANHELLGDELVLRGGTCFHKLHLPNALRYSEDLDYVRTSAGGIQPITAALTDLGQELGFDMSTKMSEHPKIRFRSEFTDSASPMRVKVEIDTRERTPARALLRLAHAVDSPWWAGSADVLTFEPVELVATKIRALHQRKKGRDLFDLWLALTQLDLEPTEILACFESYRPDGFTAEVALAAFEEKLSDGVFRTDLNPLVTEYPDDYDVDTAAALIRSELLDRL